MLVWVGGETSTSIDRLLFFVKLDPTRNPFRPFRMSLLERLANSKTVKVKGGSNKRANLATVPQDVGLVFAKMVSDSKDDENYTNWHQREKAER